jgi:hypothetical protein
MENPAIERQDKENEENGRYSDWFFENFEQNVEDYIYDNYAEFSAPKQMVETYRLANLYENMQSDPKFDKYCQEKAERLEDIMLDREENRVEHYLNGELD